MMRTYRCPRPEHDRVLTVSAHVGVYRSAHGTCELIVLRCYCGMRMYPVVRGVALLLQRRVWVGKSTEKGGR